MPDLPTLTAIAAVTAAFGVVIGALAQLVQALRTLHTQLNGRMDELVAANRAAGHAEGVASEQASSTRPTLSPPA